MVMFYHTCISDAVGKRGCILWMHPVFIVCQTVQAAIHVRGELHSYVITTSIPRPMCNVIIAGAGIAGLSTAYHLGRRGITSVRLLEKESNVATRASGRNSGMIHHYHPNRQMRRNMTWSVRLLKTYDLRTTEADFYREAPSLWLFPAEVKKKLEGDQESHGSWREVSPPAVPEVFLPDEVPDDVVWIRFDDDGLIEPGQYTEALRRELSDMGIEVQTGVELQEGRRREDAWHLMSEQHDMKADVVVNAAGAWADPVGQALGASGKELTSESRYLFYTEERLLDGMEYGFFWDTVHSAYFRSFHEGTLICAGDSTPSEPGQAPDEIHPEDLLVDQFLSDYPQFGSVEVADRWYGQRTFRPDRLPYIQEDPERERLIWAAALGGHGMTGSMWVGQRTADLVERAMTE